MPITLIPRARAICNTADPTPPAASLTSTTCRAIARFVIDAYSLAREAADPQAAVGEIFRMIEAAWAAKSLT
ncbi:hypothetical protein [Nocardia terrae]|uniref:hypothetical protein n=1 Tax=Nocardia terrae TaxID=2675851 RepID=UPI001F33C7E2|nr:hypothetical protein [Nocardia terrae]